MYISIVIIQILLELYCSTGIITPQWLVTLTQSVNFPSVENSWLQVHLLLIVTYIPILFTVHKVLNTFFFHFANYRNFDILQIQNNIT